MPILFFPHYKSTATISCHSNQSSYLIGTKKKKQLYSFPPSYRYYMWNMVRIGFMASEETSFENVDDGRRRRTDGRRMPGYTKISPMSLRLRCANKITCVPSKNSDQPRRLIKFFAVHLKKAQVLSYPKSAQQRLWSDWGVAPADLSLCWTHVILLCFVVWRLIFLLVGKIKRKATIEINIHLSHYNWTAYASSTYRLCEQQRFRRACASAQTRQNLRCSFIQAVSQEEPSDRKPDPWPLWMAGHAQLKFVMTECSKTQIRLTGLNQ